MPSPGDLGGMWDLSESSSLQVSHLRPTGAPNIATPPALLTRPLLGAGQPARHSRSDEPHDPLAGLSNTMLEGTIIVQGTQSTPPGSLPSRTATPRKRL